jgi:putative FmdB family regulatory protein
MPLFEYTCRDCGHRFEALVMGGRAPACPKCSSPDLEKLYSTFGTRSAGSGGGAAAPRFT